MRLARVHQRLQVVARQTAQRPRAVAQPAYRHYAALTLPVWLAHGVRGDSIDYHGKARLIAAPNWKAQVFPSGAYPHFEVRREFCAAYDRFLGWTALFEPMT